VFGHETPIALVTGAAITESQNKVIEARGVFTPRVEDKMRSLEQLSCSMPTRRRPPVPISHGHQPRDPRSPAGKKPRAREYDRRGLFRSSSIHLCGCPHNNRTVSAPPLGQGEAWIAH